MPFCRPTTVEKSADNLGEILTGDYTQNSLYDLKMMKNSYCQSLCFKKFSDYDISLFEWMIDRDYKASWYLRNLIHRYIDDLPAAYNRTVWGVEKEEIRYEDGFPIGTIQDNGRFIYNHLRLHIFTHGLHENNKTSKNASYTIVGFSVEPQRYIYYINQYYLTF